MLSTWTRHVILCGWLIRYSRVLLTTLIVLFLTVKTKPCVSWDSIYYIFKKHALLASCSQFTHPYFLPLMQLQSSWLEVKGTKGKVCRCILGKCSVFLVLPMESIFCQINMAKKTNVLVDALPPCSSESLFCSAFLGERPTSRSKLVNIWGVISELSLPCLSCETIW